MSSPSPSAGASPTSPSGTSTSTPSATSTPSDSASLSSESVASLQSVSQASVASVSSASVASLTATNSNAGSLSSLSTASLASAQSLSAQSVLSVSSAASVLSTSLAALSPSASASLASELSQESQSSVLSQSSVQSQSSTSMAGQQTVLATTKIVTIYTDANGQTHTLLSAYPYATAPTDQGGSSKSNTGAIVGGVVGGVAGLLLLALILWFLMRRSRTKADPLDPDTMFDPDRTVVHKPTKAPGMGLDAAGGGLAGEGGTVIDQSLAAQPWSYDGPGGAAGVGGQQMSQYGGSGVTGPGVAGQGAYNAGAAYGGGYGAEGAQPYYGGAGAAAAGAGGAALTAAALGAGSQAGRSGPSSSDSASRYPETQHDVLSESTGEGVAPSAAYGGMSSPPGAGGSRFAVANPDVAAGAVAGGARYSKAREAAHERQMALQARQQPQAYYAGAPASTAPSSSPPPTSASPPPTSRTSRHMSDDGSVLSGGTEGVLQHRDGGRFVEHNMGEEGGEEVPPSYDMIPESERSPQGGGRQ